MNSTELRDELAYDADTGHLTFLATGKRAGAINSQGYIRVRVKGKAYQAHRLAWLLHYGEWPKACIDHINGIRDDNRIANLRDVSNQVNLQNQRQAKPQSTVGLLGVSPRHGRFRAHIQTNRKTLYLGAFDTPEEAHQAYIDAKRHLHSGSTL